MSVTVLKVILSIVIVGVGPGGVYTLAPAQLHNNSAR